ncbi:major capsid protein [Microvirga yunnanensis]|uniref:major capsid protein n=1 Tax=Microvirga yunnanensis TaxID=2953740 RepID=UPI0021C6405C|nr:major capsid protein [Microvirga sp. HBU67655]
MSRILVPGSARILTRSAAPVQTRGLTLNSTTAFNREFSLAESIGIINREAPAPSELGARLPWSERGVTQRTVSFQDYGHKLEVVEPKTWNGAEPQVKGKPKRSLMPLEIYHHPLQSTLQASEIQGKLKIGQTEITPETVENAVADVAGAHRRDHEATWEKNRGLTMRGLIQNPHGGYDNVYEMLKSKQSSMAMAPNSAGFKLRKSLTAAKRTIEKTLASQYRIRGYAFIAGSDLFDALTNCADFDSIVDRQAEGAARRDDIRGGYTLAGVNLSSYDHAEYIAANKGYICPIVDDFYLSLFAPMDHFETNNRQGLPFYANAWTSPNGKVLTIDSESNAIHIAVVPEAIIEVTLS